MFHIASMVRATGAFLPGQWSRSFHDMISWR